jgi:hypothetical protein
VRGRQIVCLQQGVGDRQAQGRGVKSPVQRRRGEGQSKLIIEVAGEPPAGC